MLRTSRLLGVAAVLLACGTFPITSAHADSAANPEEWWFRDWNIQPELGTIRCPVLAVQGEDDEYGTLAQIRGIAEKLPNSELLVIPECAHSPHRDQPALLAREASRFIFEHPSP